MLLDLDLDLDVDRGLANVRDVGGLPVTGGGRIRSGVLFRSDAPLSADPDPVVRPWPPATAIDLRSDSERAPEHPLEAIGVRVHRLPFLAEADPFKLAGANDGHTLASLYTTMIRDNSAVLVRVAQVLASGAGPLLVHCAAGKDRTGVTIAVLLSAAGVGRADIVEDYERTAPNMTAVLQRVARSGPPELQARIRAGVDAMPQHLLATSPVALEAVLDSVEGRPGGAGAWLVAGGLAAADLAALRLRLVTT